MASVGVGCPRVKNPEAGVEGPIACVMPSGGRGKSPMKRRELALWNDVPMTLNDLKEDAGNTPV